MGGGGEKSTTVQGAEVDRIQQRDRIYMWPVVTSAF